MSERNDRRVALATLAAASIAGASFAIPPPGLKMHRTHYTESPESIRFGELSLALVQARRDCKTTDTLDAEMTQLVRKAARKQRGEWF